MTEERKLPAPPPRGMIELDGKWHPRRYGLVVQRKITCIYGHRIRLDLRPFEVSAPCNHRESFGAVACPGELYLFSTRGRLVWAMDVTHAESTMIDQYEMSPEEIVSYFGAGFPIDVKIARLWT